MKKSDLEYIYNVIPYDKMNTYSHNINTHPISQYTRTLNRKGYNYSVERIVSGHRSINLLRKDGTLAGKLRSPVYPSNSDEGRSIANHKVRTEEYLRKVGVTAPISKIYTPDEMKKAKKEAFENSDQHVVIKPLNLSLGRGVFVDISEDDFEFYWNQCKSIMEEKKKNRDHYILVQNYLEGFEVRATVLEGKLISLIARVPAFVIGNGRNTIEELIDEKNKERQKCGFLKNNQIKKSQAVQSFIKQSNYTLDSIPDENEYVLLISVSNTNIGGETIDITDFASKEIKETALNALAALPEMHCGGIDVMIKDFDDRNPSVIEINPFPVLSLTMFPTYGTPSKPQEYFLDAFYAKDQYFNDIEDKYDIENAESYVKTYLDFKKRQ